MEKIITNQMKPLMHSIISPQQTAFIPNQLIQDSILIAQQAFHFLKNKKIGGVRVHGD